MSHSDLKSEDWIIEGDHETPLTVGMFNAWLKRYLNIHVTPMHKMVCDTHELMVQHVNDEKQDHAFYRGMFKAIIWMIPLVNVFVVFVVWYLNKIGAL